MRDFESFSARTDYLATVLRRGVDELADILGVSRASLYGYRKGQRAITGKAWAKLEAAEREAGIGIEEPTKESKETDDLSERLDRIERMLAELLEQRSQITSSSSTRKKIS